MKKTDKRFLDYFDRHVTKLIMENYHMTEMDALRSFLLSETYKMVLDADLKIYLLSHYAVYDMWECEQKTGDPRNSAYV